VVVHALFVICIYLHKMVFNAISLSDDVTVTRWVPLLEQEMHNLSGALAFIPVSFGDVRVTQHFFCNVL
jgi:hypothetical protein